jgi:hypothetical protein
MKTRKKRGNNGKFKKICDFGDFRIWGEMKRIIEKVEIHETTLKKVATFEYEKK